ncbi:MAG: septal ring lytic transglycosylase RlpA family protein [Acidobacteriaceae bacterium]
MRILSENTALNFDTPSLVRRVVTIAAGLFLGITLTLTSVHADDPMTSVVSEAPHPAAQLARSTTSNSATFHSKTGKKPVGWHQLGLASWYGQQFQGRETANGETFNMHDLTCAHRFLPLGTWLKVTDMHTRKWIVVRVNDRGPVPETRIADLSSAAARMLGMRSRGVTRVRLDVIDPQQAAEAARLEKLRVAREVAQLQQSEVGN